MIREFLFVLGLVGSLGLNPAQAAPQLGISPCEISAQPGDLSVSSTSSNVQLNKCGETLIVFNNGSVDARVRLGSTSSTTAQLTDILVPTKTFVVFNVGTSGLYLAAVASGSTTLSFILGTASD
jgi:hypothetical protein